MVNWPLMGRSRAYRRCDPWEVGRGGEFLVSSVVRSEEDLAELLAHPRYLGLSYREHGVRVSL